MPSKSFSRPIRYSLLLPAAILSCALSASAQNGIEGQPALPQTAPAKPASPTPAKDAPDTPNPQLKPAPAKAIAAPAKPADRASAYYHASLAHMYEEMVTSYGRPEYANQAIEEYKLALDADPDSPVLNDGLSTLYFKVGRIRDAVQAAQEQVKQQPNNLEAHKLLGRIYLSSLGDMREGGQSDQMLKLAIAEYAKICELEPRSVEDHLLLGQLYTLNHDLARGEEQFQAARKLDPGSEDAVLNLARLYDEQGDMKHSIEVLVSVPETGRSPKLELALAASYDQQKDYKDAIASYRRVLQANDESSNAEAQHALAQDLRLDGQNAEALKLYRDMAAADPQDASTQVRISELQRISGDYTAALATLDKAAPLAHDSSDLLNEIEYNRALLYDTLGRYDDSTALLEKLVSASYHGDNQYTEGEKNNREIFLDRLANVYREQGKTEQAVSTYRKMADLGGPDVARGYQFIVDTYRDVHDYPAALKAAQEASDRLPKNRDLKLQLAAQMADNGKLDDGLRLAKGLLDGGDSDRDTYMAIASMDRRAKRWNDAAEELDQAEKRSGTPEEREFVYFERGALFENQKRYDEAEAQFRKVLAINPNSGAALNYLGFMQADRGVKLEESLKQIKRAVELDPQNGAYLDSLGWVYFRLGQYELAEQNLRNAVDRDSTDPSLHDHLAQLYEKTGRLKLASEQWEKSLQQYATLSPADYEAADRTKVEQHLESVRIKLAKGNGAK